MKSPKKVSGKGKSAPRAALLTLLLVLPLLSSCAALAAAHLKTEEAAPAEVRGTYRLLLYGCRYPDDVENVAILDKEGDPYTIDIYAPRFDYTVQSGLSAAEALSRAERFVQCSFYYRRSQLSRIAGPAGEAIGYEVRPLYSPVRFGTYNVMHIQYVVRGPSVVAYIRLDSDVERALRNEGGGEDHDRR